MEHPPRHRWFTRVILLFLATTLVSVSALAALSAAFLWNLRLQNRWEETQALAQRASSVLAQVQADAAALNASLYKEFNLSLQLGILATQGQEAYVGYRLNSIASEGAGPGTSVNHFFSNFLDNHPGIHRVVVYSPVLGQWHLYYPVRKSQYFEAARPEDLREMAGFVGRYRDLTAAQTGEILFIDEAGRGIHGSVHAFREYADDRLEALVYVEHDLEKTLAAAGLQGGQGDRFILLAGGQPVVDTGGQRMGDPNLSLELLKPGLRTIDLNGPALVRHQRLDGPPADLFVLHALGPPPADLGLILGAALVLVLLGIGVAWTAVRYYSSRLRELLAGIESLRGGNLGVRIPLGTQADELSFIAASFNTMVADLERHVDRVYVAELEQAKAETLAFQSQVNPHFLFNTLEAIRMRAVVQGAEDVAEMIFILSSMFRRMVREGLHIGLEDELRHCRLYLDLFRIRYPGQLTSDFRVAPGLEGCRVLKFILQPVVENYIIHGFAPTRDDNRITVTVSEAGGRIRFVVEDNGSGIAPDRLAEVREVLAAGVSHPGSVGLSNLQARLRVNYGQDFPVRIQSEEGRGCRVLFEIPARREP